MELIKNFSQFCSNLTEAAAPLSVLDDPEYANFKAGDVVKSDRINKQLLDDIEAAAKSAGVRVLATAAISDHPMHSEYSRHTKGQALDLARIGYGTTPHANLPGNPGATRGNQTVNREFVEAADKLVGALISLGYRLVTQDPELRSKYQNSLTSGESKSSPKVVIWKFDSERAGNHFNHVHVSNSADGGEDLSLTRKDGPRETSDGSTASSLIDSKFITNLIAALKKQNFSVEDLPAQPTAQNSVELSGEGDDDFYKSVLTSLGANVTPEKIKFLKAWRQAESGKAKNNPFNTTKNIPGEEDTNYNSAGVKNYPTRQAGLEATVATLKLSYYKDLVSKLMDDSSTAEEIASSADLNTWGTKLGALKVLQGGTIDPPPIAA